jgi:hypothetical protein
MSQKLIIGGGSHGQQPNLRIHDVLRSWLTLIGTYISIVLSNAALIGHLLEKLHD